MIYFSYYSYHLITVGCKAQRITYNNIKSSKLIFYLQLKRNQNNAFFLSISGLKSVPKSDNVQPRLRIPFRGQDFDWI